MAQLIRENFSLMFGERRTNRIGQFVGLTLLITPELLIKALSDEDSAPACSLH